MARTPKMGLESSRPRKAPLKLSAPKINVPQKRNTGSSMLTGAEAKAYVKGR